jgi:capsular polysaccharide biosynthesis protein
MPRKKRILVFDNGLKLASHLPSFFEDAEIHYVNVIKEIENNKDFDAFVSGLLLSHAQNTEMCKNYIQKICRLFPTAIFLEPSSHEREYLKSEGFKNYHEGFRNNKFMNELSLAFLENVPNLDNVFRIEHFAHQVAFDSQKLWVVPITHPNESFPNGSIRKDRVVFRKLVFEFSVFVFHSFDARNIDLSYDLFLVESKALRSRAASSGYALAPVNFPEICGEVLYRTSIDINKNVPLSHIETSWHDLVYSAPKNRPVVKKWSAEFTAENAEVFVTSLPNSIIGGSGAVISNGNLIHGSDYLFAFLFGSSRGAISGGMQRRHPEVNISGHAIVSLNCLNENYYHWIVQTLISVDLSLTVLEKRGIKDITVVTTKYNNMRRDSLAIVLKKYPHVQVVELERDQFITADLAIYCDNIGPRYSNSRNILEAQQFAKRFVENCNLNNLASGRLLYISRKDTNARKMLNEDELIKILSELGFEIYLATGKSISEQIKTFREAKFIVAPHGAGVTNILFSKPGTILLELLQSTYLNSYMMRLAQISGAQYYSELFFPAEGESSGSGINRTWIVDTQRVTDTIKRILPL